MLKKWGCVVVMQSVIHLNEDIRRRLESKSLETGIKPEKIVNDIINNELDTYLPCIPVKNNPRKTISVDSISGIIDDDSNMSSVDLKKELYK